MKIRLLGRARTVLVKRAGLLHSEGEGIETANVIGCLLKTGDIDCANHSDEPPKEKIMSAEVTIIFAFHLHCTK